MFKPKIFEGGRSEPLQKSAEFKIVKIRNSVIEEEKIFEKFEILGLIKNIAKEEDIEDDQLEITEEYYDRNNKLVGLRVYVKVGRAKGVGWGSIFYEYMVKGVHEGLGSSADSSICRIYGTIDNPDVPDQGGIVGEYKDGKWELRPGVIAPKATNLHLL
ncbi:MAG: hypothetical protein WC460_01630 [Patescibacteria group bacterium]